MSEAFIAFLALYVLAFACGFIVGRLSAPKVYVEVPEGWRDEDEPHWWPLIEDIRVEPEDAA